jgi:hypothetical protein
MATFSNDFVEGYLSLEAFAREDGCYRIYKIAMSPGGAHTHYVTIRQPRDEAAMRGSSSVHNPVLVWSS